MAIIRGKIESPRELRPRTITFGDIPFYEKNGKWYCSKTHQEIEVIVIDLKDL